MEDDTQQPRLSTDVTFRSHELRQLSNATLARMLNSLNAKRGRRTYWTGKAVFEEGRGSVLVAILELEGFDRSEARRTVIRAPIDRG